MFWKEACLNGGIVSAANPRHGFDANSVFEFGVNSLLLTLKQV